MRYHTDALFSADGGDTSENAAFFKESGKALWQWAMMTEALAASVQKRRPNMANVRAFLCTASGFDPVLKEDFGIPDYAREALKTDIPALRNLASQFTVWNKEKEGVASEAKRQTKNLDDVELVTDMQRPGFDFAELKRRVCTVYIVVSPLMLERWSSYIRLIFDSALRAVMRPRAPGEPKVIFVLNEAYALGKLKILGTVQSLLREYGVQLLWCWQSKSQVETVWGAGEAETMLAAAGVVASFRAANISTAEWLSKRCGDTTAILAGFNQGESHQSHSAGQSQGQTWSQQKIPAVLPHDTFGLHDGQMIQFVSRSANFVSAYAPPFWLIDQCQQRARANPFHQSRK